MKKLGGTCNHNLIDIHTPVDVSRLTELLKEADYDQTESEFLSNGFENRFSLEYEGPLFR